MTLQRVFGDGADVLDDRTFRLLVLANINGAIGAVVVSPVLEGLAGPYGIDGARLGLMMSMFTAPSIVGIPLAGALADRVGRKPVLVASLLCFGAGGTALAFTTNFTVVLALRALQGVGYSGIIPVVIASIGDVYQNPQETAAHGLRFSSSALSQAVFPVFAGALAALSWRYPFLLFAVAFPIAGLVQVGLVEPSPVRESAAAATSDRPAGSNWSVAAVRASVRETLAYVRSVLAALADPRLSAVLLALGVPAFVWITFLTYNSFFVVEVFGRSPLYASALLTILSLINATTASQTGRVATAFDSALTPLLAANVALAGGLGLFAVAPSFPVAAAGAAVVGVGFGLSFSLLRTVITDRVDAERRGGVVGIGESIIRLSNSVGPVVTGAAIAVLQPGRGFAASLRWTVLLVAVGGGVVGVAVIYAGWRA